MNDMPERNAPALPGRAGLVIRSCLRPIRGSLGLDEGDDDAALLRGEGVEPGDTRLSPAPSRANPAALSVVETA